MKQKEKQAQAATEDDVPGPAEMPFSLVLVSPIELQLAH